MGAYYLKLGRNGINDCMHYWMFQIVSRLILPDSLATYKAM